METATKVMASGLLLLLLVNVGFAVPVHGSEDDDDCWVEDRVDYVVCVRTGRCRSICREHSYVDGRCQWGFPNLLPYCECLRSNCTS
ncbi:hypothetical protein ZEAMMB73_Zm00001d010593 [Zea mays]|uniref:Knottin scorpion toxin-like domain-containing protein n=1 Tax=Zea mays TaxID=4577 RepID=K7V4F6_MAIZE|nr:hypothetical protein ZEAMMB73_Zm00001d010593 [Zea mays]